MAVMRNPELIMSVVSVNRRSRLDRSSRTKETERVKRGIVAQLEERLLHTQEVIGSRPVGPISYESLGEPASAGFSFCDVFCDVGSCSQGGTSFFAETV